MHKSYENVENIFSGKFWKMFCSECNFGHEIYKDLAFESFVTKKITKHNKFSGFVNN